jgi:hypothetical protein
VKLATRIEGELSEQVGVEECANLVARFRLVPIERHELEQGVLRPLRQKAEEVAEIRPGLDGEELTACEERCEERIDAADEEPILAPMPSSA